MAKKLVFSGYKYLEWALDARSNDDDAILQTILYGWPSKCEGLTATEMHEQDLETSDGWMVEVDE